ncbi:exocyst complex component 1 isoform X2 [Thrips palmi]|nr:exocyst complex component 1 isoform X2 [Thrips palmi]
MAAIRHTLQREVFQPNDERLLAVMHVSKVLKKKKISYLCLAVTMETPICVTIYQVKKTDKNVLKKKRSWQLNTLRVVDGRTPNLDCNDLDLHFEKVFRWYCSNIQERQNFLVLLWKQCCIHLPKEKPEFRNLPEDWIGDPGLLPETQVILTPGFVEPTEAEDYHALTDREQQDLEKLMSQCGFAISNAEAFMEMIARDLSVLDGENVQSVLASQEQVEMLMTQIEAALTEVDVVETRLNMYEEVISHVRDALEKMEEKNSMINIVNCNNQKLLAELENVIFQLELDGKHQAALTEADLTSATGLADAIAAGKALLNAMNAEIHPALLRMAAVQEQRKRFDKWKAKFSQTISRHLNNLFIHLGNDAGETLSFHANELTLPRHESIHRDLVVYAELMHWMKAMDRKAYTALMRVYTGAISKLYDRDTKQFFEEAKLRISGLRTDKKGKGSGSREDLAGKLKQGAANVVSGVSGGAAGGTLTLLLGVERDQWGTDASASAAERRRFDEVLERVLAQLEPVCLAEQNFCISFFQLDVLSPSTKNTQTTLDGLIAEGAGVPREDVDPSVPLKRAEKQVNEEVRRMMADLFGCIEPELVNFVSHYEKVDSFYCMYVLVRLSQHVMSAQDTGSFLSMSFASALVQVKRNFDRFMQAQLRSIEDTRPNRKGTCGILPFVDNFEDFARTSEEIFKNSDRRADLDKWYTKLVSAMFDAIPRIAAEHPKTPSEVVKMENYHHLFALLSQLKIGVLDNLRKEAKQRYNDAMRAYVTRYFGRPLEKLNQFFDGVQAKVNQGVKESEISYQMAFSKQELRKVIKEYPAREVKRGLVNLYRKVDKHLCEQENLLQVVWRAMQEEFIQQYKSVEDLIQRCYPGSMIALEFTISDILEFFSEIARSH